MQTVRLEPDFYAAAHRVLVGSVVDRPMGISEIAELADEVLGWSPRVMKLQEQQRPVALADSDSGRIAFSPSAMVLSTVLHELAHLVVGVDHAHDDVFLEAFCRLVARYGSGCEPKRLGRHRRFVGRIRVASWRRSRRCGSNWTRTRMGF